MKITDIENWVQAQLTRNNKDISCDDILNSLLAFIKPPETLCNKCGCIKCRDDFYKKLNGSLRKPCKSCQEKTIERKCFRCGSFFMGTSKYNFCSKDCRYQHQSATMKAKAEYAERLEIQPAPCVGNIPVEKIQRAVASVSEAKAVGNKVMKKYAEAIKGLAER